MRIQADTEKELQETIRYHEPLACVHSKGRESDGTYWAELTPERAEVSEAAVELRHAGVSYRYSLPILRRLVEQVLTVK